MRLVERFRFACLLLVIVATLAFCVSQRNVTLMLVAVPLTILSWYVTEGPRGRMLPRWGQNTLLAALVVWTVFDALTIRELAETMSVLGRFVLWLMLIKLYGRKTARDYGHLLALSAVLVMAGTLQSVEFSFAVLVFAYAALALWTVLLYQLWASRDRVRAARTAATEAAMATFGAGRLSMALVPAVQPVFGRAVTSNFRWVAVVSIVLGAILSAVVFIIFPRELSDLARREARFGMMQSGFSGEVRLFTNDRVSESRREVFTVAWRDSRGDVAEFSRPLYLRGAVLDRYDPESGRWLPVREPTEGRPIETGTRRSRGMSADPRFVSLATRPIDERFETYTQRVTMRSLASDVVFSVWAPIALACSENRLFDFKPSTLLLRDTGTGRLSRLSSYELKVQPFPTEATIAALQGGNFAVESPSRPEIRFPVPAVAEFANRTLDELRLDDLPTEAEVRETPELRWQRNRRIARAFVEWLQSTRFRYTNDLGTFVRVEGEDPIESFLTRYRFGHCEYFASALVAICQSLGVESRLVTGYVAIEFDTAIQQYIVRESNAHAWAEIRVGDYAWMTVDPTPHDELASRQFRNRSWADRWRWAWDRLEFLWNSQVVSFDSSAQATIADRMGAAWQRQGKAWIESLRKRAKAVNDYFRFGPAGYLWMGLVGFAMVLAVVALVGVRRRATRLRSAIGLAPTRRTPDARRLMRQLGFWLDALDALRRHGLEKPIACPPRQHVDHVRRKRPEAASAYGEIVDLFYRIRYGGEELDRDAHEQAKALVARLDASFTVARQP